MVLQNLLRQSGDSRTYISIKSKIRVIIAGKCVDESLLWLGKIVSAGCDNIELTNCKRVIDLIVEHIIVVV